MHQHPHLHVLKRDNAFRTKPLSRNAPRERGKKHAGACADDGQRRDAVAACAGRLAGRAGAGMPFELRALTGTRGEVSLGYGLPNDGRVDLAVHAVSERRVARLLSEPVYRRGLAAIFAMLAGRVGRPT